MKYLYYESIPSTQLYLYEKIKNKDLTPPVCIWTQLQTQGIGSRGNSWIGEKGNLFFSFADYLDKYKDVPLQSFSVYFGWIFKKALNNLGSSAVMKWPNDIYLIEDTPKKIGGVITQIYKENLICGIGLNTKTVPRGEFSCLDIDIKNDKILSEFFNIIDDNVSWFTVIREFRKEFEYTKKIFNIQGEIAEDGSIIKNRQRIYSKR